MRATTEKHIYTRGKCGTKYVRLRIPSVLRVAYCPRQTEVVRSLGTADLREAKSRAIFELAKILAEFEDKKTQLDLRRVSLAAKRIHKLSDDELRAAGRYWMRQVLTQDERRRRQGLEDEEFDALGTELTSQHAELRRMLAQGQTLRALPALRSFLYLCGLDYNPDLEEGKRASRCFVESLVATLGHQLQRQQGEPVDTDTCAPAAAHPLHVVVPELASKNGPSWEAVFDAWRDHVVGRPKSTQIAYQTPWTDLRLYALRSGVSSPESVTALMMSGFVNHMRERGLAVNTINERLSKIRSIYKIARSTFVVSHNPAEQTLGRKESTRHQRQKRRLSFSVSEIQTLFGTSIYTEHRRSQGQSGEASYWIPLLMYYTGARPEEIAGLALCDLQEHPRLGWLLSIVDRPSNEDEESQSPADSRYLAAIVEEGSEVGEQVEERIDESLLDEIPESHRRTLKNSPSIRRVPVAQELLDLGLLRYVAWVSAQGHAVFFPTLTKDWHGKLSGSFSKFFGRYKCALGITDSRKVLYSFRHSMKDHLEEAAVPSKYLKRILGHTSGDGPITEGYGSELPWRRVVKYFRRIKFPLLPALPWQPGRGPYRLIEKKRSTPAKMKQKGAGGENV